jgi:hypothetical protein
MAANTVETILAILWADPRKGKPIIRFVGRFLTHCIDYSRYGFTMAWRRV